MPCVELIDSLVETCAFLYLRSVAMETILDKLASEDWHHMMDTMLNCDEAIQVRASFVAKLAEVVRGADAKKVLADLTSSHYFQ